MTILDKNNFCELKTNLRRSTILSSISLIGGLFSITFSSVSAFADCSNGGAGNTFSCSGAITSTQQITTTGNATITLDNTFKTAAGFNYTPMGGYPTGSIIYMLNNNNYNVTYSGGSTSNTLSISGGGVDGSYKYFDAIYASNTGLGAFNITNELTLNSSVAGVNGSGTTGISAVGIDAIANNNITITNNNNITASTGTLQASGGYSAAYGISIGDNNNASAPALTFRATNNANKTINVTVGNATYTGAGLSSDAAGVRAYGMTAYTSNVGSNSKNIIYNNAGTINVTTGNVTSSNPLSRALSFNIAVGEFAYTNLGSSSLTNDGTINVTAGSNSGYKVASFASGMAGLSSDGSVTLTNNGSISVTAGNITRVYGTLTPIISGLFASPIVNIQSGTTDGGGLDTSIDKFITNSGSITVSGDGATGIYAIGNAGQIIITNGANASINTSGASGAGINASTTSNTIDITNNGTINSSNGAAMSIRNLDTLSTKCVNNVSSCTTTITNTGTLIGLGTSIQTATIALDPLGEGNAARTIINNTGTITTQSGSINDYAIAVGSPLDTRVTVNNTGKITGKIEINQNKASFKNSNQWSTTGTNNFKGGQNSITNSAGAVIQSQGDTTFVMDGTGNEITNAGTIRTIGGKLTLDPPNNTVTVYNSGLIDMANDGSGSVANVVQIDGNFVASGNSTVAVNTQLGGAGSQSDRLLVVGNASGTNTSLVVRDTKGGVGAYNPFGTAIVGYGGTSTGGFTLSAQSDRFAFRNGMSTLNKGLYFYYIGQGTGSTGCDAGYTCYSLYSAPSTAAKSLPIAITAAQSLWQETALMWEDRQVELRDELTTRAYAAGNDPSVSRNNVRYNTALKPQDGGISTWIKSVGAWTNRNNNQTQWGGGGNALSYDLSYRQNSLGMLGGADWSKAGFLTPKDYLVVGVMGGYLNSSVNFNQEAGNVLGQENFTYQGGTVGGSISYMLNGFFADALFKNDMLRSNMRIPVIGLTGSSTGVNTAGGVGNLGYRLNYGSMFFEPMATLTYSNTYMGGLNDLGAQGVNVSFGPGNDFRGGFGGRVGSNFGNIVTNHILELSLTGRYWNMFNSNAGRTVTIVSDFTPDTIGDYTLGRDYGEIKGNVNVFSLGSGMSAFINTGVRFNDHFQTVITKGGLAYRF